MTKPKKKRSTPAQKHVRQVEAFSRDTHRKAVARINKALREKRLALGLLQREVAAKTELSQGAVNDFEHDRSVPTLRTALSWADALGIKLSTVLRGLGL